MTTKITTRAWNSAEHLHSEEDIRLYIEAALEEAPDDAAFMALVLGNVARARNMAQLARETGIARETLYKVTRGEGNPTLDTISRLAKSLGFRLTLAPLDAKPPVAAVARQARGVREPSVPYAGKAAAPAKAAARVRRAPAGGRKS